jgi:predicted phosphoadenosine phosphosulfate sulfurtransferase
MQTNLYKFMISQIKKTQNAARGVYKFVPMFDFTDNKLIDWTADLDKLNNKLYKLYNLSSDEIKYIEEKTT